MGFEMPGNDDSWCACLGEKGPLKSFCASLKKPILPATAVQFFTLMSNLHKLTSFECFHDVIYCNNHHHLTTSVRNFLYSLMH